MKTFKLQNAIKWITAKRLSKNNLPENCKLYLERTQHELAIT